MDGPTPGIPHKSTNEAVFIFQSYAAWCRAGLEKTAKAGELFAIGAELFGDFIIRIVEEHLDIRLAVSRGSPG
jgi:hypothetical protein